jgi:uncharacterized protein (TIGR02466 family)
MGNLTSVDMCVLDSEPLSGVRKFIEDSVADYFTTVHQPIGDLRLNITQSWCNYSEKGQWHHRHTHSNSFISGVFYPQANIAKDKIYFYKDGPFIFSIPRGDNDWNTWNSDSWWFEVGTGDLILFPSSLQHGVDPVDADETRISLSFNTFPVGVLGNDRSLTRLVITDAKG